LGKLCYTSFIVNNTERNVMFNSVARVKLVQRKDFKDNKKQRLNKYRLVCAFNVTDTIEVFGVLKFKFPIQSKCDYVSGDFYIADLDRELARAKRCLRTDQIQITSSFPPEYEGDRRKYTFVEPEDVGYSY
jgi:hypothetical protein